MRSRDIILYVLLAVLAAAAIYVWGGGRGAIEGWTGTRDTEFYVIHDATSTGANDRLNNIANQQVRLPSDPLNVMPAVAVGNVPTAVDPNLVYDPTTFGKDPHDVATYLSHFAVIKKQYDDLRKHIPTRDGEGRHLDDLLRVWDSSGVAVDVSGTHQQIALNPAFPGYTVILEDTATISSNSNLGPDLQAVLKTLASLQVPFDLLFLGLPSMDSPNVDPLVGTSTVYQCNGNTRVGHFAYVVNNRSMASVYRALLSMDAPLTTKFRNMIALKTVLAVMTTPALVTQQ